jgi:hypothetical protein
VILLLLVLAQGEGPDFELDVLPVLTRSGCNSGTCHGSAKGQGGFRLSLLGTDPDADHESVALDLRSRRIHRAEPAASLLLRKSTGVTKHEGGRALIDPSGVLLAWIRAGAPRRTREAALVGVTATPSALVLPKDGEVRLKVEAAYADGSTRDVSALALYGSNDEAVATVSADGRATVLRPGETAIVVRYGGFVVPVRIGCSFGGAVRFETANLVDGLLARHWTALGVAPAGPAGDAVFLRRAHLDLIGTLPTPEEVRAYLAKPDRAALVDALLKRPEFDVFWTLKFSQWLLVGAPSFPPAYAAWLRSRLDEPIPETARLLVTATGTEAPASFFSVSADPRTMMEFTLQTFHGFRMQCANCHNHPLERFPQDDYHSLAAVYARIRKGEGVVLSPRGELTNPRTGKDAVPRHDGPDRRVPFAAALVSDPAFARAWANRLWGELFGRGLVHPVDDLRSSNPPSIPGLLEALAGEFAKAPRLRPYLRLLATSNAYALSSRGDAPEPFFARALVRPLPAEVVLDAMAAAGGTGGPRAIERTDPSAKTPLLEALGRCGRETACSLQGEFRGSLRQALALATIEVKAPVKDPAELYLRALGRPPSEAELAFAAGADPDELLWALVSSAEFQMRH